MSYAEIFKNEEDPNITYMLGDVSYKFKNNDKEDYCEISMPLNIEMHKDELKTFLKLYNMIKNITLDVIKNHTNFVKYEKDNILGKSMVKMAKNGYNKIKKLHNNKFKGIDKYLNFNNSKYVSFKLFPLIKMYFNIDKINTITEYYQMISYENFILNPLAYVFNDDNIYVYLMEVFNDKEYLRKIIEKKDDIKKILFKIFDNDFYGILDFNDVEIVYNGNKNYFIEYSEMASDMLICFTELPENIGKDDIEEIATNVIKTLHSVGKVEVMLL